MKASILLVLAAVPVAKGAVFLSTNPCVEPDQPVVVGFENDDAQNFDWIGLYPKDSELFVGNTQVRDSLSQNWVFSCGTRTCTSDAVNGPVAVVEPDLSGSEEWVAVMGRWQVGQPAPYEIVVVSEVFNVKDDCSPVSGYRGLSFDSIRLHFDCTSSETFCNGGEAPRNPVLTPSILVLAYYDHYHYYDHS